MYSLHFYIDLFNLFNFYLDKENFEQILVTIIGGATEVTEASIRKMAFNIMLKIIDTWG